jgi:SNF2 family DNA or RNA helicase
MSLQELFCHRYLTEKDPRASEPSGFVGHLRPPQATLLHALIDLETEPRIKLKDGLQICTNVALISEKFSFGKTVVIIALVCASPQPRAIPASINLPFISGRYDTNYAVIKKSENIKYHTWRPVVLSIENKFYPELTCHWDRLIPSTLVVVASSIITQWENAVAQFAPHLRKFTISDMKTLAKFYTELMSGKNYDIVIAKIGNVSNTFQVPGEPPTIKKSKTRSIITVLRYITDGAVWARCVWDDYDSINLTTTTPIIPSLFTWLISATERKSTIHVGLKTGVDCYNFIQKNIWSMPILGFAYDDLLKTSLSFCCQSEYVNKYLTTTTAKYRKIVLKGGMGASILKNLGVKANIVEMIQGGAIGTAAEALGMKCCSIQEIVVRILQKQLTKYYHTFTVLDRINNARQQISYTINNDNETNKKNRKILKNGTDEEVSNIIITRSSIEMLDSLEEWAINDQKKRSVAFDRLRTNISEQLCQVCMVPISEVNFDGSYIANCCQLIICTYCVVGSNHSFIDKCPNCLRLLKAGDLIYVGKEIKLAEVTIPSKLPENISNDYFAANKPKLRALMQIIKQKPIECIKDEPDKEIDGLLQGDVEKPWPTHIPYKFLIFTLHPETTEYIHEALNSFDITHVILSGTHKQKDKIVASFKKEINVMIVTASRNCSGLHIPEASHVIFYHTMDYNIEQQIAGRAQRIGREYSLEIIRLTEEK